MAFSSSLTNSFQVEDSYQALTLELDELEEGLRDQINQSGSLLSSYLRQDDYTLQRLAADSVLDVDNEHVSTTKVENLTAKLSAVICEEFQFRLNRVYLQHLVEGTDDQDHDQIGLEEQELETDLDSLHVEISDVAAMSIFQDFKAPLLRTLADEQNKKTSHAQAVLERVCRLHHSPRPAGPTDRNRPAIPWPPLLRQLELA